MIGTMLATKKLTDLVCRIGSYLVGVESCCECKRGPVHSRLRVKIKSLAAEARIIRQEERRHPGRSDIRSQLYRHRVKVVRVEARAAHLLHMFAKYQHAKVTGLDAGKWCYDRIEPNADRHCYFRGEAVRRAKEMGRRFGIDTTLLYRWTHGGAT